ncbi:hypothetical protein [Corallococcus aberystwythensis]|uniref:Alpha-L-rhamnosidase six-hairpin glycosidase domain-containing protein n=1 Tax=Corallococcus aberystwythensis TaxID=2316722 RepID=A0A3A8Q677_9BACT|nr:hypothetical protein [Corallococcus aberystwythensis]RKH64203.1 hypothetical protein D7W81_18985 [Corallococcus aberystwythensis]
MKRAATLVLAASLAVSPPAFATDPFQTSSRVSLTLPLNEYWNIYGLGWHLTGSAINPGNLSNDSYGGIPPWSEWDAMKFAWTNDYIARDKVKAFVEDHKVNGVYTPVNPVPVLVQPTGYVWSWSLHEGWLDNCVVEGKPVPPRCLDSHALTRSFHFDQVPAYINGIHILYLWTRDAAFLNLMLPRAEVVMDSYMLGTMQGASGLLVTPGNTNNGTATGRPSTYMDQIRSGHKDGWVNASFYSALRAMGDLEEAAGNPSKALAYRNRAASFPAQYRAELWTGNRYAGWRDVNGVRHDAGYTYVNLPALVRGLPSPADADRVLEWLDSPVAPSEGGARNGSTSAYQHVFAPRSNTLPVTTDEWDHWSNPDPAPGHSEKEPRAYGTHFQNGGTFLWVAYYDIMARLRYRHADDAMVKFQRMLTQMTRDAYRLTYDVKGMPWHPAVPEGDPDPYARGMNSFGELKDEVGTNGEFSESGLNALTMLYGFMGVSADLQGLHVKPEMPTALLHASVADVNYRGTLRSIQVIRGEAVAQQDREDTLNDIATEVGTSSLTQTFFPAAAFNEVGVRVGTYAVDSGMEFDLSLESSSNQGASWAPIVTRRLSGVQNNAWVYMAVPPQPANDWVYRLTMRAPSSPLAWWRNQVSTVPGVAIQGSTMLDGDFSFRAVQAPQSVLLSQTGVSVPDTLNGTLGQVFDAAQPFDRATLRIGTYVTSTSGFTAKLFRDNGEGWKLMAKQTFKNVVDNSDVPMNFASMKPGRYYLEIGDEVGSIAWYRDSASNLGPTFWAAQNGISQPGNRTFQIFRGQYTVKVPERGVSTPVLAGDRYTMSN